MPAHQPVNLLWTGGWDSTFRLLDLAIRHRIPVQPHYLLDHVRASTGTEVDVMLELRGVIEKHDREAASLVRPTRYREKRGLPARERTGQRNHALRARTHLGGQYRWLVEWAEEDDIDALELCIHRDDRAFLCLDGHVRPDPVAVGDGYVLAENVADDAVELFRPFRFPLLDWTKERMHEHAKAQGFEHILHRTWFCHEPLRGAPCGRCNPCRYAVSEGMAWRIPLRRRLSTRIGDLPHLRRLYQGIRRRLPFGR